MVKNYDLFLESNEISADQYILGVPSGEIIDVDIDIIRLLLEKEIIKWERFINNQLINCYCFNDIDRDKILQYIENLERDRVELPKKKSEERLADEFRRKLYQIIHKNVIIGYQKVFGYNYYYAIIPDLNINKNFYEIRKSDLNSFIKEMNDKNFGSFFYYKDRLKGLGKITYYGMDDSLNC